MSSATGPGDWVERWRPSKTGTFAVGGLYCVEEIGPFGPCATCSGCEGVRIVGVPMPNEALSGRSHGHLTNWWPICCFRPVYRPKADLIEQLKQPAPQNEREHEHA